MLAVAALDKSLSMVWWRWYISVSQLRFCWSMIFSFWAASLTVCMYYWCAATRMSELELEQRTNIKFLVVSWCWCWCKFTGIMLWRKQQFTSGWNVFLMEEKVSLTKGDQDGQKQAELKKALQNSSNCAWKSWADCQEHSRASEQRQRNRKILTEDLDMRKVCAKMVPKELNEEQKRRRVFSY